MLRWLGLRWIRPTVETPISADLALCETHRTNGPPQGTPPDPGRPRSVHRLFHSGSQLRGYGLAPSTNIRG
jgi:hypothetical protein